MKKETEAPQVQSTAPPAAAGPPLPLLATKLALPPPPPTLVSRPRLTARLQPTPASRLALLVAPAGSGKSCVVSEWCRQNGDTRVAWLSLDANDNEPTRFLLYVSAALETVAPEAAAPVRALLQSPQPPSLEYALTLLLNGLAALEEPITLVLDDYHAIEALPVHHLLAFLLDHLPPTLFLILASRSEPPLPLARLRVRGQLVELRAPDLRFTHEEAAQFLNERMGLSLAPAAVARLAERTEGWIAGLQLAALSLQGQPDPSEFLDSFTGSNRYLVDYLFEEVLERQPEAVQEFLRATAILDRLCSPLCEAVTGTPGGQAMLERLEAANLFLIPLDQERRWYRYHHLFAEALRVRLLMRHGDLIAGLHGRAAGWYEEQGMAGEAIEHALAGGDDERAARLIEGQYERMFRYGEQQTLGRWLKALPAELIQTRPLLSLALAAVYSHQFQIDDAGRALNECRFEGVDEPETRDLRGKLLVARGWTARMQGEKDRAVELSRQGLDFLSAASSWYRGGALLTLGILYEDRGELAAAAEAYAAAIAECRRADDPIVLLRASYAFGRLRETQGARQEAERLYRAALAYARERGFLHAPLTALIFAGLGRLSYQANDLAAAAAYLEEGRERTYSEFAGTDPVFSLPCDFELMRIKTALGDAVGAEALFEQLVAGAQAINVPYFEPVVAVLRVRRPGALGEIVAAWLAEFEARTRDEALPSLPIPAFSLPDIRGLEIVTWAQLRLAQGQTARVVARLERFLAGLAQQGRYGSALPVRVLLAPLSWQAGRRERGVAILEPALTLAAREGHVRVFLEGGAALLPVLRQAVAQGFEPRWGEKLLAAFDQAGLSISAPPGGGSPSLIAPLSEREMEVLRLVAAGLSNGAIAAQLFVSLGTVRRHVHNLCRKLGATNRISAVARARALGLF